MRGFLACVFATAMLAVAADTGVPPRNASTDYPAHGPADAATIAADIVPASQVAKMFSSAISKDYIVVEVAIYPDNGVPFDVKLSDFALRVGQRVGRADQPTEVGPWQERRTPSRNLPVDITAETGVIYQRGSDPYGRQQQGVGTYTGVAVSPAGQNAPPPPPNPKVDPQVVSDKVRRDALPEGQTKTAIAGYLYFSQYAKRRKSDPIELKYARDYVSVSLVLGKP
jgi:hypothetical protein